MSTIFCSLYSTAVAVSRSRVRVSLCLITFMRRHPRAAPFLSSVGVTFNTRLIPTPRFFCWRNGVYNKCCGSKTLQEEDSCCFLDFFHNSNQLLGTGRPLPPRLSRQEPGQITLFVYSRVRSDSFGFLSNFCSNHEFEGKWSRAPVGDLCVCEWAFGEVGNVLDELGER